MSPLKLAGLLLFIASVTLILGFIAAETLYPNYSLSNDKLSDLGAKAPMSILPVPASDVSIQQPSSLIFNSTVFLAGVLIAISSLLICRGSESKILGRLLVIPGIGGIIVGLLTEQMGMIHYIGAIMVFVFGPLAAIVSYRSVKPPFSYLSIAMGLISLAFVPFVAIGIYNALLTYTIVVTGGAENMIVYPFLSWMLAFGTYLMKD
jgi:hypothetical membrane protein